MLGAGVHLELRQLLACEAVTGKHPLHRGADDFGRTPVELLAQRAASEPAGVARVAVVDLRLSLVPRDRDLLRVHDDDEVARVDVRRELGLALAAQDVRDPGRQPAEGLALRIDDVPLPLDLARFGAEGLHHTENRRTGRPPRADCTSRQSSADGASAVARTRSE